MSTASIHRRRSPQPRRRRKRRQPSPSSSRLASHLRRPTSIRAITACQCSRSRSPISRHTSSTSSSRPGTQQQPPGGRPPLPADQQPSCRSRAGGPPSRIMHVLMMLGRPLPCQGADCGGEAARRPRLHQQQASARLQCRRASARPGLCEPCAQLSSSSETPCRCFCVPCLHLCPSCATGEGSSEGFATCHRPYLGAPHRFIIASIHPMPIPPAILPPAPARVLLLLTASAQMSFFCLPCRCHCVVMHPCRVAAPT